MTPLPSGSRSRRLALGVLLLAVLLVAMDATILYFAAPYISADLAPSGTQQLWMLDVYGFVLAGLLITMGALADRFGRRRVLMLGAAAFGSASALAAFARDADQLIVAVTGGAAVAGPKTESGAAARRADDADMDLVRQLTRRLDLAAGISRLLLEDRDYPAATVSLVRWQPGAADGRVGCGPRRSAKRQHLRRR